MIKTIAFLGAGGTQTSPIEYAKNKGYKVITFDNIPSNPGHVLSDMSYNISITEYDYRAYDPNYDYTWNARIHLVDAPTSGSVLSMQNFSIFESNGSGFTCSTGVSYSPTIIFEAKIFNSLNANLTQLPDTPAAATQSSNYPAGNILGTLNVDYAIDGGFSQNALYQIDSYDA